MPQIYSERCDSLAKLKSEVEVLPLKFGGAVCNSAVNASATAYSRVKTPPIAAVKFQATIAADAKMQLLATEAEAVATARAKIKFFVNSAPIAPPIGFLSLSSVGELEDYHASPDPLARKRLIAGDTIPIFFRYRGQKLINLQSKFSAKQKVAPGVTPIVLSKTYPGAIEQTAPALDAQTGVETVTGNFLISASDFDVAQLLTESEFTYQFTLSDGGGRRYTVETGSFTMYPVDV